MHQFEDTPRPDTATLALPLALALFFLLIGLVIGALAALFLPPPFWLFVAPVLALCGAGLVLSMRRAQGLRRTTYRIEDHRVTVQQQRQLSFVNLSDLSRVAVSEGVASPDIATLPAVRAGGSITRSARDYANRAHGVVYLEAGGEWLRLSPTDPSAFLTALDRAIRGAEHAENTSAQPRGDEFP